MGDEHELHGYGGPAPQATTPEAERLGLALLAFLHQDEILQDAKRGVPSYTGQWSPEDYYAEEQHRRNVALNELFEVLYGVAVKEKGEK